MAFPVSSSPRDPDLLIEMIFGLRAANDKLRAMLETIEEQLQRIAERLEGPIIYYVNAHAHIFGRPHGAHYYDKIGENAAKTRDERIDTRLEIAELIHKGD